MSGETEIKLDLVDLLRQDVRAWIAGDAVLTLEGNAPEGTLDDEEIRPDPIRVFADCASLGMFSGAKHDPATSATRVIDCVADVEKMEQAWRLELQNVDKGAYRILLNLLLSMEPDSVEIKTLDELAASREPRIDPWATAYPGLPDPIPLLVDYEPPDRSVEQRAVHLVFLREPDEQLVERACAALKTWSLLLMLGGYTPPDLEPPESSVFPDVPFQYDAYTVEQAFEFFFADETAFGAIVNWVRRERSAQFPIERISIF
jgi:hypothetical protein